ncbi:MAG: hypothetical protein ABI960_03125 [Candidatus Eisenbacteria bacterium]
MFSPRGALLALGACAALAAGCAQEGKLVDAPLAVNGVSYDLVFVRDTTIVTSVVTTMDVHFKISVHATNACEARHGFLELRRVGTTAAPTYILQPTARYNLDDACTALGATPIDTVLTLTVSGVKLTDTQVQPFQVETSSGPALLADVDTLIHATTASTIRFQVRVEDRASGAAVAGATVEIEQLGGGAPVALGSGVSDANGLFALDTPSSGAAGAATLPYRVTVTNGPDTRVISMPAFPARGQSRERVLVRL